MDFVGIDSVTFGADDLKLARKRLDDWGLAKVSSTNTGIVFATGNGGQVIVRHESARGLPPRLSGGSQFREVVFGGGREFTKRGWTTEVGPGRHPISSAYFWYFKNPLGGAIKYFCDPDFITERWKPNNYRVNQFSEWHLVDGIVQKDDGRIRPSLAAVKAIEAAQAQGTSTPATASTNP